MFFFDHGLKTKTQLNGTCKDSHYPTGYKHRSRSGNQPCDATYSTAAVVQPVTRQDTELLLIPYVLRCMGDEEQTLYVHYDYESGSCIWQKTKQGACVFVGDQSDPVIEGIEEEWGFTPDREPLNINPHILS